MSKLYDTVNCAVSRSKGLAPEASTGEITGEVRWRVGLKLAATSGKYLPSCASTGVLRGAQRRQRRLQVRIVLQRVLDQCVERRRFEQRPPFLRNVAALDESCPGRRRAADEFARERLARVAGDFGCGGMSEVRADGATCQKRHGRESGGTCQKPPDRYTGHWKTETIATEHDAWRAHRALFPISPILAVLA